MDSLVRNQVIQKGRYLLSCLMEASRHDFKEIIFRDSEEEYTVNTERQEDSEGLEGPYKSVSKELKVQEDLEMSWQRIAKGMIMEN